MKWLICVATLLIAVPTPLSAAETPKHEVFGGYSFLNSDFNNDNSRDALHGWSASYSYNPHKMLGLVADFGGHYKTFGVVKLNTFEFLFGPQLNLRTERTNVFGHLLYGGLRAGGGSITGATGFAMGYGGGLDLKVSERIDLRAVQVDWIPFKDGGVWNSGTVRFGFGVVLRPGR